MPLIKDCVIVWRLEDTWGAHLSVSMDIISTEIIPTLFPVEETLSLIVEQIYRLGHLCK